MSTPLRIAVGRGAPRLLVSVATPHEAALVAAAGVDFIDLKDPRQGALGGLPLATLEAIVGGLGAIRGTVSATIGDLPVTAPRAILARVAAVAACGVDLVKVGVTCGPAAPALLDALAACGSAVVPVFIADHGLDAALLARAATAPFAALMIDTADKRAGSLFELIPDAELRALLDRAHDADCALGVAGALRLADWPRIAALAPDFAGFRSAVCAGWRGAALAPTLLERLLSAARGEQRAAGVERIALEQTDRHP